MAVLTDPSTSLAVDLERVEAVGYADLWSAAPARLAREHGIAFERIGDAGCRAVVSHSGHPFLNHCLVSGTPRWGDQEAEQIRAFYSRVGAEHVVGLPPHTDPGPADTLRRGGYTDRPAWAKFHRGVEATPRRGSDLLVVDAAADPEAFGAIFVAAFDLHRDLAGLFAAIVDRPRWHTFLALDGASPVGAASLFVDGRHGWFAGGATLAEQRGRGAQGALMATRVERAREVGCVALTTETGVPDENGPGPSYRNMLRHGFRVAYDRPNLASPAAEPPERGRFRAPAQGYSPG